MQRDIEKSLSKVSERLIALEKSYHSLTKSIRNYKKIQRLREQKQQMGHPNNWHH